MREVEKADSGDHLLTSLSLFGTIYTNFETLDAKILMALMSIMKDTNFKKKVFL